MTYEEIKEMNAVEPYSFETDMEENWYNVGLVNGADTGYRQGIEDTVNKACEWLRDQEEMIGISFEEDFIERFKEAMNDYETRR